MTYVKTDWQDLPARTTPITADRLNNLESQYDAVAADITDPESPVGAALNSTFVPRTDAERFAGDAVYRKAATNVLPSPLPTVTVGTTRTISGQIVDMKTDPRLLWHGVTTLSGDGNAILVRPPRKTDGTFDVGFPWYWSSVEFMVDCTAIEFRILASSNKFVVVIDGERHTATNGVLGGGFVSNYLKVDFGARKADGTPRRIQLHCEQAFYREIGIAATDTLFPIQSRPAPVMAFLGDSYGTAFATRSLVSSYDGYPQQLARLFGFQCNSQNCASSTGYTAGNGATASTYASRVADIVALDPAVVVVQGSINDFAATEAALSAAVNDVLGDLRAALPDALIFATGILAAQPVGSQGLYPAQNDIIQAAAAAQGAIYIDTEGWVNGTGKAGATTGDGNADVYVHSDGAHPTTRGGLYFAARLAGAMRAATNALQV